MAQKLTASMPPEMDLEFTYTIQFAALDPTTGDPVAGVVISDAAMLVDQVSDGIAIDLTADGFVPFLTPVALEDQQTAPDKEIG